MAVRLYSVVVDAADPPALARWWAAALRWRIVHEDDLETTIAAGPGAEPMLTFVSVPEPKSGKNRLHLDLAAREGESRDAEVARLETLGARRADVGQGGATITWVVLADPEGNEFCVLRSRD